MRSARFGLLLLLLLACISTLAQQPSPTENTAQTPQEAAQAAALMQRSATTQNGGTTVNDVTLSGTVTIAQGTNQGSGTIAYSASIGGKSRGTLTMPSGARTSFRDYSASPRIGTFTGPDGVSKSELPQDLMGPHPAWYFPSFITSSVLSSSSYASADIGQETLEGTAVRHIAIWPTFGRAAKVPTGALQQPGQEDLYLDPSTLLPVALTFNVPGKRQDKQVTPFRKVDVYAPEEVRFSDYRQVQGLLVAFHLQVYLHQTLVMDIHFSSVTINTGAVISAN